MLHDIRHDPKLKSILMVLLSAKGLSINYLTIAQHFVAHIKVFSYIKPSTYKLTCPKADVMHKIIGLDFIVNEFNLFYSTGDVGTGKGLGLFIVKKEMAKFGGAVDSSAEQSTSLTIQLPLLEKSKNFVNNLLRQAS